MHLGGACLQSRLDDPQMLVHLRCSLLSFLAKFHEEVRPASLDQCGRYSARCYHCMVRKAFLPKEAFFLCILNKVVGFVDVCLLSQLLNAG